MLALLNGTFSGLDATHDNMNEDPRMRMAFRFFDKDGSLGIKPEEFAAVAKLMKQDLTPEEMQLLHNAVRSARQPGAASNVDQALV